MKESYESKIVNEDWIKSLGKSIGIGEDGADTAVPGTQADGISGGQLMRCKYCNKPISVEQGNRYSGQPGRCKECIAEALISSEDADEVIGSCICVLDEVYGIKIEPSPSVNLQLVQKGDPVRVETLTAGAKVKPRKGLFVKKIKQETETRTINIGYEVSRVRVIESFLEECFQDVLQPMDKEEAKGEEEKADTISDTPESELIEENSQAEEEREEERANGVAGGESKGKDNEREEGRAEEEKADKPEKLDKLNAIRAWLVANCLYTMGELIYAQQYIADYQEQDDRKLMDVINSRIGVPWNVMGIGIAEIVEKLDSEDKSSGTLLDS